MNFAEIKVKGRNGIKYCEGGSESGYIHVSEIVEYPNRDLYNLMSKITSHEDFEPRRKPELDRLFGKAFYKGQWYEEDGIIPLSGYKSDYYYLGDNFLAANFGKAASLIHFYFKVGTTQEEVFQTLQELTQKVKP